MQRIRGRLLVLRPDSSFLTLFLLVPAMFLLVVPLTLYASYKLGGPSHVGFFVLAFLASFFSAFVFLAERLGYARNFASWDLPLRRILIIPVAAGVLGFFFWLMILLGRLGA